LPGPAAQGRGYENADSDAGGRRTVSGFASKPHKLIDPPYKPALEKIQLDKCPRPGSGKKKKRQIHNLSAPLAGSKWEGKPSGNAVPP